MHEISKLDTRYKANVQQSALNTRGLQGKEGKTRSIFRHTDISIYRKSNILYIEKNDTISNTTIDINTVVTTVAPLCPNEGITCPTSWSWPEKVAILWLGILTSCWTMVLSREPEHKTCLFQASVPTRAECPVIVRSLIRRTQRTKRIETQDPCYFYAANM